MFFPPTCIFQTSDYVFLFWGMSWIVCSRNSKMERITNLSLTKLTFFYPKRGIFCNLRYSKLMATLYSYLLRSSQDFFSYRLQLFETFISSKNSIFDSCIQKDLGGCSYGQWKVYIPYFMYCIPAGLTEISKLLSSTFLHKGIHDWWCTPFSPIATA